MYEETSDLFLCKNNIVMLYLANCAALLQWLFQTKIVPSNGNMILQLNNLFFPL